MKTKDSIILRLKGEVAWEFQLEIKKNYLARNVN